MNFATKNLPYSNGLRDISFINSYKLFITLTVTAFRQLWYLDKVSAVEE